MSVDTKILVDDDLPVFNWCGDARVLADSFRFDGNKYVWELPEGGKEFIVSNAEEYCEAKRNATPLDIITIKAGMSFNIREESCWYCYGPDPDKLPKSTYTVQKGEDGVDVVVIKAGKLPADKGETK